MKEHLFGKEYLFVYGSLLLEDAHKKLGFTIVPKFSSWIIGYKLKITPNKTNDYNYFGLVLSKKRKNRIPGYLCEISGEDLKRLDKYEGKNMFRILTNCHTRNNEVFSGWVYLNK